MSAKVLSAAVIGLDAEIVEVEADMVGGDMGVISVVGLPDAAVSESRERVKSAIKNSSLYYPKAKVTVNLAPADLRKHGPIYDLPIAISLMLAAKSFSTQVNWDKLMFVGELALAGDLRPVNGILPIAMKARRAGIEKLFVPQTNAEEAKLVKNLSVVPVSNLKELVKHLSGKAEIKEQEDRDFSFHNKKITFDMSHINGQEHVKRAMEIAAAGAHNMSMSGPPGSGKTLIARTMPSILPNFTLDEALEVTKIYSVSGELKSSKALVTSRPFRSPHHTASGVALVGGGTWPRPGEISLAHRGVLFLDEFPEFPRQVLEYLRQPLEDGVIHISRAAGNLSFPAKFILVSAMNPCPCGYTGDAEKECICSPSQIIKYRKRISGPILDRIDLHVEVPRVDFEKLNLISSGESSEAIKKRVEKARALQNQRLASTPFFTNSEMSSEIVKKHCELNQEGKRMMKGAVEKMYLSARAYFRILKLARTIADLGQKESIQTDHLAEALQYRPKME